MMDIDAHAKPPQKLRDVYKRYQKLSRQHLDSDIQICDIQRGFFAGFECSKSAEAVLLLPHEIRQQLDQFLRERADTVVDATELVEEVVTYKHPSMPGRWDRSLI